MVHQKFRYLLVEVITEDNHNFKVNWKPIYTTIMKQVGDMHGDYGYSSTSSLQVKVCDGAILLLRVSAKHAHFIASALPFIRNIAGNTVVLNTIFQGASVRSCEKRLLSRRRAELTAELAHTVSLFDRRKLLTALSSVSGQIFFEGPPM